MSSRIDTEKTQKIVSQVLEKIKAEVDPWLLDEYHSLFKREVSLFNRSRVAAYLLMLVEQGKGLRLFDRDAPGSRHKATGRNNYARPERDGRRARSDRNFSSGTGSRIDGPDSQRYPLADKDSKWLFFSVGRSRRISPREILSLINTKTALPKEDIGAIRIFDNYSFVQVRDTVAETIIVALTGHVFRGRPLAVNYAKSRKDGESDANDAYDGAPSDDGVSSDDGTSSDHGSANGESVAREAPASEGSPPDALEQQGQDHLQEKDV
ncbi:MAG: DbpA RNA binding domain-containing protein [Treponema sp.]|nr:DbpA RNA binding domain-containing protein [Treponema sp.]